MLRQTLFTAALLMLLFVQAQPAVARADEIADGEREYVQQLQSRQFFDLAEQFCVRQSENGRTPDERAAWQLMLADCREQHAWMLREPGRTQILTYAAESITEFVRKESPRAELDLLLRVCQIELLSTIARIDATCSEFGPKTAPQVLAMQAMTEGLQLAEAMLEQIDQIRTDIEGGVARAARDRTRHVVAELLLLQARKDPADAAMRTKAVAAADHLMKSSGDDEMRFQARGLLAESLLDQEDFKAFDLLVISLTSAAENQVQQMAVAALKIRGLLRRDQPSEARQLSLDLEKRSLRSEELSTLRLASLLKLFELLHKLDAADLRQKTADEFRLLYRRLSPAAKGVWRDCCERIALRFNHADKFGPEAATALESVADLMAAGNFAAARKSLLEMRPSFERSSPQIAATLSMQAGDLAIRMSDWQAAEADLASAVAMFQATENRQQEAASDLLRIYAMGRHWDAEDLDSAQIRNTLEAAYLGALEHHIAKYSDSATTAEARQWRAMLIRATDPVAAADDLLALTDGTPEVDPMLLIQAGEILIEVAFGSHAATTQIDSNRLSAAVISWTKRTEELLASTADTATASVSEMWHCPVLEIQRLVFSLQRRWSAQDDWRKLATDAALQIDAIAALGATDEQSAGFAREQQSHIDAAKTNGHAIIVLAVVRQLLGFDAMQKSRDVLLQQTMEKRHQLSSFLLHLASETNDPIPGDPQLGFLALDLLRDEHSAATSVDRQLEDISILLSASKVADNFQQFDAVIDRLAAQPLTDVQLQATATILQRRSAMKTTGATSLESIKTFWRSVIKRSRSGEDQWLEASLQLATIGAQEHNFQDAFKVLNVISALHPEWGTPERKTRAASLKARLESSK